MFRYGLFGSSFSLNVNGLGNVEIGTTTPTSDLSIVNGTASNSILSLQGAPSQSGHLMDVYKSDGTTLIYIDAYGRYFGGAGITVTGGSPGILVQAGSAAVNPLVVKGYASQTADLTQWQNNSGTVLDVISSTGSVGIGTNAPTQVLSVAGDQTLYGNHLIFDSSSCASGALCNYVQGNLVDTGTKAGTNNAWMSQSKYDDIVIEAGISDSNPLFNSL